MNFILCQCSNYYICCHKLVSVEFGQKLSLEKLTVPCYYILREALSVIQFAFLYFHALIKISNLWCASQFNKLLSDLMKSWRQVSVWKKQDTFLRASWISFLFQEKKNKGSQAVFRKWDSTRPQMSTYFHQDNLPQDLFLQLECHAWFVSTFPGWHCKAESSHRRALSYC